ncbi:Aldose reductase, partial [Armadillidium vulgare]
EENIFGKGRPDGVVVFDPDTDHVAIWRELEKEVKNGRVRSIGLSNFNKSKIDKILKVAEIPPAVLQIEAHCYFPQKPLVEYCQQKGIAVTAYSPLGAPWTKEGQEVSPKLLENPTVLEIAKKYNKNAGQVLLRFWVQRNIIVIPKSITPERIRSNFQIMDFCLTEDEMKKLFSLDRGKQGRAFHFTEVFKGSENHKEYPF